MGLSTRVKIIIGLLAVIIVVIILSLMAGYQNSNVVTITASNTEAIITVQKSGGEPQELGKGTVSRRLEKGDYAIRAVAGESETRAMVHIDGDKPQDIKLALAQLRTTQKISDSVIRKPFATGTSLQYLNTAFGQLESFTFSSQDAAAIAGGTYNLVDVYWIDANRAYVIDSDNNYSYVDGAAVTPLQLGTVYQMGVGPDGTIATFAEGKITVRASPATSVAYTIKTNAHEGRMVLGSDEHMLVYDTIIASEGTATPAAPEIYKGKERLAKASDALKGLLVTGAMWAPNGKKVAIASQNGLYILDVASAALTRLSIQDTPHANSFNWIDDTNVLFFTDQIIWRINTNTQTWEKLARITESVPTTDPFAISPDRRSAYFITDVAEGGGLTGGVYSLSLE